MAQLTKHAVQRTQYWDPNNPDKARDGFTSYGESLTDVDYYLRPLACAQLSSLHRWGVAGGLKVTATPGQAGVRVGLGTAVDVTGNLIALTEGGKAVVDRTATPPQDIPTVTVDASGLTVPTTGLTGDLLLTLTWREVLKDNDLVTAPVLQHAPWLMLVPVAGFSDDGEQVVLAQVTLDGSGNVAPGGLSAGPRRAVGTPAARLELRTPRADAAGGSLAVDESPVGEWAAGGNGDVVLTLLGGAGPRTAMTVDQTSGLLRLAGGLSVSGDVDVAGQLAAGDVTAGFVSGTSLSVSGPAQTGDLTVAGQLSANGASVEGASWLNGSVYTGDVFGHWDGNATLWLSGSAIWDGGDGWLNLRSSGGKTSLRGDVTVEGGCWANGQVHTGDVFGHWGDGVTKATAWLAKSAIWDGGDGWLNLQSAGGKTYLRGEVTVQGVLHKPGGGFRIDHPLEPDRRYLSHSFVESPEMVNLYAGTAVTDDDGVATVSLPDFFEALNRDHRFQLTPIGQLAMAAVEGEVRDNAFTIRTDKPGVTVSWQVTGVRQDSWAEAHRIPVVEEKPPEEQGRFLHPELYGQLPDRVFLPVGPQPVPVAAQVASVPQTLPATPPAVPVAPQVGPMEPEGAGR